MKKSGFNFTHIGIFARDLAAMERFYTGILDFTVTDRGELEGPDGPVSLIFMSKDPDEHHQIVLISGRPEKIGFNVINQISLKGETVAELKEIYERLQADDAPGLSPVTHGNALSVYVLDPEGNRIELYVNMPWYVTQPMRVPIDFSLDEAALMKVTEEHARKLPGFRPRSAWQEEMKVRMGLSE